MQPEGDGMESQCVMDELLALADICTVTVSRDDADQYRFEARREIGGRVLSCGFRATREEIQDGGTKVLRFRLMGLLRAMSAEPVDAA